MAFLFRTKFLAFPMNSSFHHPSSFFPGLSLRCPRLSFASTKQKCVFKILKKQSRRKGSGSCCWCSEAGDAELELKILEFMRSSEKPEAFPTRRELEKAGRFDLAEEIRMKGGWFALGWDLEENDDVEVASVDFDMEEFRSRVERYEDLDESSLGFDRSSQSVSSSGTSLDVGAEEESGVEGILNQDLDDSSLGLDGSSQSVSSSGTSLDVGAEEDSGVEGILKRLEEHRKSSNDITSEKSGDEKLAISRDDNDMNIPTAAVGRSNQGEPGLVASDSWRTWSAKRAGFQDTEFEPAEITQKVTGDLHRHDDVSINDIRARILHLEVELDSAFQLMRSKSKEYSSKEVSKISPSDMQQISDAFEFLENQFMHAQESLRSIRAKLTVLEGKMTFATKYGIDGSYLAMQLLRTTHITWPNSASEVLLAGSFDGWTSQRKMEKSSGGIFSVTLLLYPGRYEIKFIVDGEWMVDPLRPIIRNRRHENNLLIIK